MARHRNIRSMNYNDECEGLEDIYGHSVEDDYCISPSDAGFIFDRSRSAQMSSFLNEENDIAEEDECIEEVEKMKLSDIDEARLRSCVEDIQNVIGDTIPLLIIQDTVIKCNFNVSQALDKILNQNHPSEGKKQTGGPVADVGQKDVPSKEVISAPIKTATDATAETVRSRLKIVTKGFDVSGSDGVSPIVPTGSRCESPVSGAVSPVQEFETPNRNQGRERHLPVPTASAPHSRCQSPASGRASPSIDHLERSAKSAKSRLDAEAQYKAERGGGKEQLHMVVIGHVDAGKSTLMGRMLYELGQVNKKTMHKYETESKKIGKQSFVYAWILDETGEERSRGITMDVGQSKFETKTKMVHLLDAPGHKDFIPNMISGAAQADVAVLVVDATTGEFETGFESGGQTREHALLVRSLGVSQLAVVINKLDTVNWSEERFKEITGKLTAFLKQAGFRESDVTFIPCSGLAGTNLAEPSKEPALTQWYSGPSLIDVIDSFKTPERPLKKPFRMSVSDIYKGTGSGICVSGRVETGMLHAGDRVHLMPQNEAAIARGVQIDEMPAQCAYAGDSISVTLTNCDPSLFSIGSVLCDSTAPVPVVTKFEARIVVFNISIPITTGYPIVLHAHSLTEQATITKLISQLHKSSGEVVKRRPRCLTKNSNAVVEIEATRPVCLELYRDFKELGRLMMRVNGATIAAGLVTKLIS